MKNFYFLIVLFAVTFDLNAADLREKFFLAAKQGDNTAIENMLNDDLDVNSQNILNESALMFAIDGCQTETVRLLLSKGAETDFYTKLGYTPLIKAAALGCSDIVRILLQKKADIDKGDPSQKFNALSKAVERNHADVVQILLDSGANANYTDTFGVTPLMIAAQKGHLDICHMLIDHNADVNAKSLINQTALLRALDFGRSGVAQVLINNGANVADLDKYNRSTLMLAAAHGDSTVVKMLVEKGVDLNLKNDKDQTAAAIAQSKKYDTIANFLVAGGADTTGLVFEDTTKTIETDVDTSLFDTPPTPIGGIAAIQKRLRYPKKAKDAELEGTIIVDVLIDRRGRVRSTEILESFGDEACEQAAIRAIKNTRWKAAKKGKKSVEAPIEVPVEFTLNKKK